MSKHPLTLLFEATDKIFMCDLDSEGHKRPVIIRPEDATSDRNFFCINPIKSRRLKSEVASYRNFLFEQDVIPIAEQFKNLDRVASLGIVATATYSGGKSIHYIVSCSDNLNLGEPGSDSANEAYRLIWLGLENLLATVGLVKIDQSNKNPVSLSRTPGAMRGEIEQELFYTGNLVTADFLKGISYKPINKPKSVTSNVQSVEELEQALKLARHSVLHSYLTNPLGWINDEAQNYPTILRLTLWAIDELNVDMDNFMAYFEKYTVPYLHSKNYFKDWRKPIEDAYKHKFYKGSG